jgi:hypothetical protein
MTGSASLRLLIVVGGHGAFVAAFRNRAEIVPAHVNRQPPKPAARPFSAGSIRSAAVAMVASPSVEWMVYANPSQGVKRLDGRYTGAEWGRVGNGPCKDARLAPESRLPRVRGPAYYPSGLFMGP